MALPQSLSKYWQEVSDLTIYDAALWVVIETDPSDHEFDLDHKVNYAEYYEDHPGGEAAVYAKCDILISAVRTCCIKVTPIQHSPGSSITVKTHIPKADWVDWCRQNGYVDLSNLFTQHIFATIPPSVSIQPIAASVATPTISTTSSPSTTANVEIKSAYTPFNAVGKLTIKAAEEIEQGTGIRATAKKVMGRLQEWADSGIEPATLMRSSRPDRSVIWKTDKQDEKSFSTEACGKTLEKWNKGRH
jgi:hypothetical protein